MVFRKPDNLKRKNIPGDLRHRKTRLLTVDGLNYRWRFRPGYQRSGDLLNPYECYDRFTAFLEGHQRSPLHMEFITWEDSIIGGPLRTGALLALEDPTSNGINLHQPKWAASVIQEARRLGWIPEQSHVPFRIPHGIEFLVALLERTSL